MKFKNLLLALFIVSISFFSCSKDEETINDLVGTWEMLSMKEITTETGEDPITQIIEVEPGVKMILGSDGKISLNFGAEDENGTYTVQGNRIKVKWADTADTEESTYLLSGNSLTVNQTEIDGSTRVETITEFKRVK